MDIAKNPCQDDASCLSIRRIVFLGVQDTVYDQWRQGACSNCKLGYEREVVSAKSRPTNCCEKCFKERDTRELGFTCRSCATTNKNLNVYEAECIRCGGVIYYKTEMRTRTYVCLSCQGLARERQRHTKCRGCGDPLDNTYGYCWKCRDKRRSKSDS